MYKETMQILRPETAEEISSILKKAQNEKKYVYVKSNHQQLNKKDAYHIDLLSLKGETNVDKFNTSMTASAGKTIAFLKDAAVEAGLDLPFTVPNPSKMTVGAAIAANCQGPWRYGRRSLRDHILGLKVVLPNGEFMTVGGNTIKNVAGLDLGKLMIGSRGSLGIITEVNLKLMPLPQIKKVGEIVGKEENIFDTMYKLRDCCNPAALVYLQVAHSNFARVLVGFEGNKGKVDTQWKLAQELSKENNLNLRLSKNNEEIDKEWEIAVNQKGIKVQAHILPGVWPELKRELKDWSVCADLGTGVVWLEQSECEESKLIALKRKIQEKKGWVTVEGVTFEQKVFPLGRTENELLRSIKRIIDPAGILNAGCLGEI